jgi:hypothetical protein
MDALILFVANALRAGNSIDTIHAAMMAKEIPTDDAFLAIKAGECLFRAGIEQALRLFREKAWAHYNPKPAPFGRQGFVKRTI